MKTYKITFRARGVFGRETEVYTRASVMTVAIRRAAERTNRFVTEVISAELVHAEIA